MNTACLGQGLMAAWASQEKPRSFQESFQHLFFSLLHMIVAPLCQLSFDHKDKNGYKRYSRMLRNQVVKRVDPGTALSGFLDSEDVFAGFCSGLPGSPLFH